MNSKDALEILNIAWSGRKDKDGYPNFDDIHMALYTLDKNLELLEKLERNNQNDKEFIKLQNEVIKIKEDENSKLKKVIEILKGKKVSTTMLWNSADVDDHNLYQQERYCLTQEEYDLLKELL